jgi:hypothetical protein
VLHGFYSFAGVAFLAWLSIIGEISTIYSLGKPDRQRTPPHTHWACKQVGMVKIALCDMSLK